MLAGFFGVPEVGGMRRAGVSWGEAVGREV
jgi:hypothetical protein